MKRIKQFLQIFVVLLFITSCRKSVNKDFPIIDSEENSNENSYVEKKRMEIKFSCGDNSISKYLNDGWIILKEDTQEKICTWKSVPATKDCDMEKDKGCKITKPDKIGEENIYLLEKTLQIMSQKSEILVDLIFMKLKKYKSKEISLEKENLKKFIFSLFEEKSIQRKT